RTLLSEARSSSTRSSPPPFVASARASAVACSALTRSRAAPTTSAPWATRARADSTPRPADTPVTSTRFPLRSLPESTSSVVDVDPKGLTITCCCGDCLPRNPDIPRSLLFIIFFWFVLNCWNRSSVDDEFGAVDIRGAIGYQETNELGNFLGASSPSDRNPAE